jgi:hypothetical protein
MRAAVALPIVLVPAKAGAAEVNEVGFTLLGYKERGLMKVTEPIVWAKGTVAEVWEIQASGLLDIVSGASPEGVSNVFGKPVQVVSGASVVDHRKQADLKVARHLGDLTLGVSGAWSTEEDYFSRAFGLDVRYDLNQKNTTLAAGIARSSDIVGSSDDPGLHEPRVTREYLVGITQILSRTAAIQSTLTHSRGRGWYNDPYRYTITAYPPELGLAPLFFRDKRPDHRDSWSWLTRYRRHFPDRDGTLQLDYRYFTDDWHVQGHTIEAAWQQQLSERWALRPALRYYTQRAARFYGVEVPAPAGGALPEAFSSDQRLASFGGLSPSLKAIVRFDNGVTVEATAGYTQEAANLRLGGSGSEAFTTLRAAYGLVSVIKSF